MKDCVGMLLAGGEGKRLGKLTDDLAKPAVHFGGKYRIIDYTLSNCTNSGIQTVGVMTQYSPLELNKHIGNGRPWDLNQKDGGATILSPYTAHNGGAWYSGTADAIYQNMHFIDHYDPEEVLVISGDHIYQMDYAKLLDVHRKTKADATISVLPVAWGEASRFGILNTTDDLRVYDFDEKPDVPKSNLASMGIYIFNWKVLKSFLIEDASDERSSHDFGKDIIPAMLHDDLRLYAYRFDGYWKDVGTVQSYWEANMDMLDEELEQDLITRNWHIYTNESNLPPQYIDDQAIVTNSLVDAGCWVSGEVERSLLFKHVEIDAHSHVSESILHPSVKVGEHAILERVIVMENTSIPPGTVIQTEVGEDPRIVDETSLQRILAADESLNGG